MATLQAWPGDDVVVTVDAVDQFTSNLSGLNYEAGTGANTDVIWAIQNGPSMLYRLVFDGTTMTWVNTATNGWAAGKTILYPNGMGGPDSEGVTTAEAGTSAIYVSTRARQHQQRRQQAVNPALRHQRARDHADGDARVEHHRRSTGRGPEPGPRGDHLDS